MPKTAGETAPLGNLGKSYRKGHTSASGRPTTRGVKRNGAGGGKVDRKSTS